MRHAPLWFLDGCRPLVWLAARALFGIRFEGVEHVPRVGPVVLTPNHVSYMDPVLISIPIRRPLRYMTLEPFFRVRGLGPLIRWAGAFPVRVDEADGHAVRTAVRLLRAGEPLVIFPEGGRSRDGRPVDFRPGAFRLALGADVPIVPVTIAGAFEAWPPHRRLPRPGRIRITYHPPLTRKDLPADADRKALPRLMAAAVRERIASALPA
ncbi:MAG: lysophospholipid acyltransferase family protein [Candidatus Rokuibacteriota bacterium]